MGLFQGMFKDIFKPLANGIRGKKGESQVNAALNPLLFGRVPHRQINNLILVDENGKSHQIDHIEIRQNGIFCIETKNYKGWIFGGENQDTWTQVLYREKHQFLSPIKQNKSHIYQINRVLGGKYRIHSLVVMVQNNANKIPCPYVINLSGLRRYLKRFDDGTRLSIEEMDAIYHALLSAGADMSTREHVKSIKRTQKELKQGVCPRCGGQLVTRQGKYGPFTGCSNYPKCTFILKK